MTRPKTGNDRLVQVRISEKQYETLVKLAELRNTTVADVLRQQIRVVVAQAQTGTFSLV